jgi:four helix bundle protein
MENKSGDLKDRTYQYSINIASFCQNIEHESPSVKHVVAKLFEVATNIGLLARLAFKGRNNNDFKDKLNRIINDADSSIYWLDMLIDLGIVEEEDVEDLLTEASELIAIFISISKKSKSSF